MGLTALWREGLLAQKILLNKTKGYRAHPQLNRFRASSDPVLAIGCYLKEVLNEASERGYRFDSSKIERCGTCRKLRVQRGQMEYEWSHLLKKLKTRDLKKHAMNSILIRPKPHPLFQVVPGGTEEWERVP